MHTEINRAWNEAGAEEDLFDLYLEYVNQARQEIEDRTLPGSLREHLLAQCRAVPREHFEARLEALQADENEYEQAVEALRRGYEPSL